MPVSRRRFLLGSAAALAATAAPVHVIARPARRPSRSAPAQAAPAATPAVAVIALNRMGYGARPGDVARVTSLGLSAYIEEQLNPGAIDDSACDARIANMRVRIKYGSVNELRSLSTLNAPIATLWHLSKYDSANPVDYQERMRPWYDVRIATWLRALYSKRQLKEVLADFWHNHFNVNAPSDAAISAAFPTYDRDVIRANCLGNFRTMLEAVATSTAMLYSLDNVSNLAGPGEGSNENYARELFELHTLGADNYLDFYDNINGVGANSDGDALGYVDADVYEAANCFSGWTVANGDWRHPNDPDDGTFYYFAGWHDTGRKIVLSIDGRATILANQAAMVDGRQVLDMLANHRGTARSICTKLCRRLISDNPTAAVVDAAVAMWMANRTAPDQIKRVVRVILQSTEFATTWGQKIKRPFEATVAYLRATGAELGSDPSDASKSSSWGDFFNQYGQTGHRLFEWPTPTGHPDTAEYWASTNGLLRRWNLPFNLVQDWGGRVQINLVGQTPSLATNTCTAIVDFWLDRLIGYPVSATTRQVLIDFMRQTGRADRPPVPTSGVPDYGDQAALTDRLTSLVQLIAMSPEFSAR